jgi:hypothetical protein
MERLDGIVKLLEKGDAPLDELPGPVRGGHGADPLLREDAGRGGAEGGASAQGRRRRAGGAAFQVEE